MFHLKVKKTANAVFVSVLIFGIAFAPVSNVKAADLAESASIAADVGADLAAAFAFLHPNNHKNFSRLHDRAGFDGENSRGDFPGAIEFYRRARNI